MFIITKRLTRARAVGTVLLLGLFLAGLILLVGGRHHSEPEQPPLLETNADRLTYLAELGWQVQEDPLETLHLQLPEDLSAEEHAPYLQLQLSQGFDLLPYAGRQVVRYTYAVENYPNRSDSVQLNLYCCDGAVIAGDIIAPGESGFQGPLTFPAAE